MDIRNRYGKLHTEHARFQYTATKLMALNSQFARNVIVPYKII